MPAWVTNAVPGQRGYYWAPDVLHRGDRYWLFYSVSRWGRNTSGIGLVSVATLKPEAEAFDWRDEGLVMQSTENDNFNAIDPSVMLDGEGRLWLAFGSFWSGIKLVELDASTGKRREDHREIYSLASHPQIEAPCLAMHEGRYYLLVNWGLCCRGTNSTYEMRVGRSDRVTGPYLDREGKSMREGGGSLFLNSEGRFIGPGHAGIFHEGTNDWLSCHFYDGTRRGAHTLAVRRLGWDAQGWPVPGDVLSPPEDAGPR